MTMPSTAYPQFPQPAPCPKSPNSEYYWVVGAYNGKGFRLGPFLTEEEANTYGYQKLSCSFDVKLLPTRSMSKAGNILKKGILDDTSDLSTALNRMRRKAPDEYKSGSW